MEQPDAAHHVASQSALSDSAAAPSGGAAAAGGETPAAATPAASVRVQFRAVGSAPVLARAKFKLAATEPWGALYPHLRRLLAVPEGDVLTLELGGLFAPLPEQSLGDLSACFGGELVVQYGLMRAGGA